MPHGESARACDGAIVAGAPLRQIPSATTAAIVRLLCTAILQTLEFQLRGDPVEE
jgi:hypothetical protein